jgi:hypothetical protein
MMTWTKRWCCSRSSSPVPHNRSTLGQCRSGPPLVLPENMGLSRRSKLPFHLPFQVARATPAPVRSSVPRSTPLRGVDWNGTARLKQGRHHGSIPSNVAPDLADCLLPRGREGLPAAFKNSSLVATPLAW